MRLAIFVLALLMAGTGHTAEIIRWGVFAYRGIEETTAQYEPIANYLDDLLPEYHLSLHVLPMERIYDGIEQQTLDFVTTNPTHFLVARRTYPLTGVMATLVSLDADGMPVYYLAGCIVTRADRTDIQTLRDVRGKRVGAPSLQHMGGYRAQAYELAMAGVKPDQYRLVQTKIHQEAIYALL